MNNPLDTTTEPKAEDLDQAIREENATQAIRLGLISWQEYFRAFRGELWRDDYRKGRGDE